MSKISFRHWYQAPQFAHERTVREEGLSAFCVSRKFFLRLASGRSKSLEREFTLGVLEFFIYDRYI